MSTAQFPLTFGIKIAEWTTDYRDQLVDAEQLQSEIDAFFKEYDEIRNQRKQEERKRRNQPDAEGWITVTKSRRGVVPPAVTASEAVVQQSKSKRAMKRKAQDQHLGAFYSYEVKDSKLKRLQDLRQKFDDDKKRLADRRSGRKFKP